MVNARLTWVLESRKLLPKEQFGCRKNRSCVDALIGFENHIQCAFRNREHAIAVIFDLNKAYDMIWRYNILKRLDEWGIRERLPLLFMIFLEYRTFRTINLGKQSQLLEF